MALKERLEIETNGYIVKSGSMEIFVSDQEAGDPERAAFEALLQNADKGNDATPAATYVEVWRARKRHSAGDEMRRRSVGDEPVGPMFVKPPKSVLIVSLAEVLAKYSCRPWLMVAVDGSG